MLFALAIILEGRGKREGVGGSGGAVGKEDGESIDYGVAAGAACAEDELRLKLQGLVADRADEPAEVLCGEGFCGHLSIVYLSGIGSSEN